MKVCLKFIIWSTDSSDEQSAFEWLKKIVICSLISFLSLQFNQFLQSEIKWKLFLVKKNHFHTATADTEIKVYSAYCGIFYSGALCYPPQSAGQIKKFLQLVSDGTEEKESGRKKKLTNNCM